MQRVLVLPQQPDFRPGGHSPLHHPQPPPHAHLPAFIPHPAMMPLPPHLYTGIPGGVGDMSSQYTTQYHPAHIYSEQGESEPVASGLCCSIKKSYSFVSNEYSFAGLQFTCQPETCLVFCLLIFLELILLVPT